MNLITALATLATSQCTLPYAPKFSLDSFLFLTPGLLKLNINCSIIPCMTGEDFGGLPDVCHSRDSTHSPKIGDTDFGCSYDGCNSCSGCSCDEEGNLVPIK